MSTLTVMSAAHAASIAKHAVGIALAAASLSVVSLSASAQIEPPRQTVEFRDLDLANAQDTQRLYRRLRTAASEVCSQFKDYSGAVMRVRRLQCEGRALGNAVAEINHPSLTALHTSKSAVKLAQGKSKFERNT